MPIRGAEVAWEAGQYFGYRSVTIAQSPIMGTTITLSRLKRRGYEPLLDYYFKVCPHYQSKQEIFPNV